MKRYLIPFLLLLLIGCRWHCVETLPDRPTRPVVILYENDVHCAVDGYARLAALREEQRGLTPYVTIVSCGDFVQGDVVGSVSQGESIVKIMNQVGYDVVTLGNHEFDFGMSQMFKLTKALDASVVSANFRDAKTDELLFPPYRMIQYGDVKIAYLGLTTTTTVTSVSPLTFLDETGNIAYNFSKPQFYENVQHQIDKARSEGADYVVVLAHMGDRDKGEHPNTIQMIARTKGIDVVLDGHDHSIITDTLISNLEGTPVLLSSTGTKFKYIGKLTLSTEGTFSSNLEPGISETEVTDKETQMFVDEIKQETLLDGQQVIGVNEVNLSIYDAAGNRLVRSEETNIGNFCTDAFRRVLDVDVSLLNGGGIRSDIPKGDVTYNHLLSLFPFNNTVCTAYMTGQQLVDILELSVSWLPEEDGSFMQVSGVKFEVDTSIPSSVLIDENQLFAGVGEGPRRVRNVQILDKDSGTYQPVNLNRTYTLAAFDFQLKEYGCSGAFRYVTLKDDNLGQDVEVLASYLTDILKGRIGKEYEGTEGRIRIQ